TADLEGIIDFYKKKSSPIVALYDVKKTSLAKNYATALLDQENKMNSATNLRRLNRYDLTL
ncbi:MAG: hypothetical protein H3Z52_04070, partial [archaeon]|nr:hypothetical protein [archaeon]